MFKVTGLTKIGGTMTAGTSQLPEGEGCAPSFTKLKRNAPKGSSENLYLYKLHKRNVLSCGTTCTACHISDSTMM